ncbi:MAG TPA: hypothetical protein VG496_12725, partial [Myxococcales bacterium]|nr:hypothetical protein [Myxococcales bacterium]
PQAAESRAGTVAPVARPPATAGSTVLFAATSVAPPQPAASRAAPPDPRSTTLYGGPPPMAGKDVAAGPAIPASAFAAPAPTAATIVQEPEHATIAPSTEAVPADEKVAAVRRGPPRAAIVAVAAAIGVVFVLAGVVAAKKLGRRGPSPAALEQLAEAQLLADKDAIPALGEAEAQANAALLAAGDARFPQAYATVSQIQVAWADALADQAWFWGETANRVGAQGDDRKKGEAEAKAIALQDAAKSRLKAAFEAAAAGNKADAKSPDVALALADYYRAAHSRVNLARELKRAALLNVDPGRIAFIEGAELASREDGGPKAVERFKVALTSSPRSARIHFRLAMAYLAMHQDGDAKKELLETLRLSPQHERAKLVMELLTATGAAKATTEGDKR